jgi:uncharacterized membrane protein
MLTLLLTFLPDEALPLVIMIFGLLIIIGVMRPRTAMGFIVSIVLSMLAAPFIEALFAGLPLWLTALVLFGFAFWILRTLMETTLGPHAAGHVIGTGVVALVRFAFTLVLLPFRLLARILARPRI